MDIIPDKRCLNKPKTLAIHKAILVFFGIFIFFVLLEIGLRLGGFIFLSLQEYQNWRAIKKGGEYRIMCIGESTTAGGSESYPFQLNEILNQRNMGIRFAVINKGVPAITTSGLLAQLGRNLDQYKPHMVVAMIGINDDGVELPPEVKRTQKFLARFTQFRVYKLIQMLMLHISAKLAALDAHVIAAEPEQFKNKDSDTAVSLQGQDRLPSQGPQIHIKKGYSYIQQGDFDRAEEEFKKAISENQNCSDAYVGLGWTQRHKHNGPSPLEAFKKAVEINPQNAEAYEALGWQHILEEQYTEAGSAFKKLMELRPDQVGSYMCLGWYYSIQGNLPEAERILKKAITVNPVDRAYGQIALIYLQMGKEDLANMWYRKATTLRLKLLTSSLTRHNYLQIKEILNNRRIKLVCVQYPVRSIELLRRIFENDNDVIFVDNEQVFKEVLKKERYSEYFTDLFGGDFGHCTKKGNRLLAENIANTISREVFRK